MPSKKPSATFKTYRKLTIKLKENYRYAYMDTKGYHLKKEWIYLILVLCIEPYLRV